MNICDELDRAIESHLAWKNKLKDVIESGSSRFTPEFLSSDQNCAFGWWLINKIPAKDQCGPYYKKVRKMHAQFHIVAGKVMAEALLGSKQEAKHMMADGSEYAMLSTKLINELRFWKAHLKSAA